jgi:hypothetical protein
MRMKVIRKIGSEIERRERRWDDENNDNNNNPEHTLWWTGSSVDIATGYGLDGPGIESRGGKIFRTYPDRSWGPPSLLYNGYRVFPGGRKRPGRNADPSPPSSAEV